VRRESKLAIAAALATAALAASRSVPPTLVGWPLSPDAVEHLAIANALAHGAGFVDPVQWAYYLPAGPPLPAFAVRAPVVPLLLAAPLALGATLSQVLLLHALWASLLAGACVLVAHRFMALPAAIGAGLGIAGSAAWATVASRPLTEATALGALLLVLATVRGVQRSVPGALACAACTLLAWATRPNLGILAPAVVLAALWQAGPRAALRSRALWAYALGFALLHRLVVHAVRELTGAAPYAGYGFLLEVLRIPDAWLYQTRYAGPAAFVTEHASLVAERLLANALGLLRALFVDPSFQWPGWLLLPALWVAVRERGRPASEEGLEARVCLVAALGLALVAVANYAVFDPRRFPLPIAIALWLAGMWALERAGLARAARAAAGARGPEGRRARLWRAAPLAAAALLFAPASAPSLACELRAFAARPPGPPQGRYDDWDPVARAWCPLLDPDALVAAPSPWSFTLWCGNAALRIPSDLVSQAWLARYLDEKRPRYLAASGPRFAALFAASPRLVLRAAQGRSVLYEVAEAEPPDVWRAPPPLACAGRAAECARPRRRLNAGRPPRCTGPPAAPDPVPRRDPLRPSRSPRCMSGAGEKSFGRLLVSRSSTSERLLVASIALEHLVRSRSRSPRPTLSSTCLHVLAIAGRG
jgi:hypothetical protein